MVRDVDTRTASQITSQSWCANKLCPFQYKISVPDDVTVLDYLTPKNTKSMFLSPADENEVLSVVHSCKTKTYIDIDGVNMKEGGRGGREVGEGGRLGREGGREGEKGGRE